MTRTEQWIAFAALAATVLGAAFYLGSMMVTDADLESLLTGASTDQLAGAPTDQLAGAPTDQLAGAPTDQLAGTNVGPDVKLEEKRGPHTWNIWALVNAADSRGISIYGVKKGDEVTLDYIYGVGYFGGQSGWSMLLSTVVRSVGGVLPVGDGKLTFTGQVLPAPSANVGGSKSRDGWGRNLGDGKYGKEEGGIVICLPSAKRQSLIYARDENRLTRDDSRGENSFKEGSEWKKYSEHQCSFPLLTDQKTKAKAVEDGVLILYAFDSNYIDNAGAYEVKLTIERSTAPTRPATPPTGSSAGR